MYTFATLCLTAYLQVYMYIFFSSSVTVQVTNRVVSAALVLQSIWRGRAVRLSLVACHHAAVRIQAVWRGFNVRQVVQLKRKEGERRSWAATIIQVLHYFSRILEFVYMLIA